MSGTFSRGSLEKVLDKLSQYAGGDGFQMIDIGAGSGVVAASSFAHGASSAVGIELKDEGQADVWSVFKGTLSKFGVPTQNAQVYYGRDVARCVKLPEVNSIYERKAVLSFCDGWEEADRAKVFELVGEDSLVRVFMCSCGKGKYDKYASSASVLGELNRSAARSGRPAFIYIGCVVVKMFVSNAEKTLHIFT